MNATTHIINVNGHIKSKSYMINANFRIFGKTNVNGVQYNVLLNDEHLILIVFGIVLSVI
jgi:hypothetical protein